MRATFLRFLTLAVAILAVPACGSSTNSGGGSGATGTTNGDKATNSGSVTAKSADGSSTSVSANAPASQSSAAGSGGAKQLGAMATDKILVLYISDATSLITITVDTDKNPLPASGIKVGDASSGAFVTYTGTAGAFTSDGSAGTLDITSCPADANNTVTVGKLNGVVVTGASATGGAGSITLDGTFNLVYFGGYGTLKCTAPATSSGSDAGTTDVASTAGGTCGYQICGDTTKNCCPYMPCLQPCFLKCSMDLNTCITGCMSNPTDMNCPLNCSSAADTCMTACLGSCKVSDSCKTAAQAFNTCAGSADQAACANKQDNDKTTCEVDQCCTQAKAAF